MKPHSFLFLLPLAVLQACSQTTYPVDKVLRVDSVDHLKFGDHDPVKIQGRQPKKFPVHGIDISRHNKAINWAKVKRTGVDFCFHQGHRGAG